MSGSDVVVDGDVLPALPELTLVDSWLLIAGARLDRFVLERYLKRRPFTPPNRAGLRERLAEARDFYADPRFIAEPGAFFAEPSPLRARERRLAALRDGELIDLRFETDFVPAYAGAQLALDRRGLALWWRHREPGHPVMLCVHGYAGGHLWLERLAFDARRFYGAGVDVVLYVLPYHGARAPAGSGRSGEGFFDMDLVRTNEAFAQAIYELRALLRYCRSRESGPVGAFGMSLGGYTTALLATVEPELAFAVPMIPLASLADMMWSGNESDPRLQRAAEHGWNLAALRDMTRVHAPLSRAPVVPHERRLIIAALGDRICPPAHADVLWRHWGQPRIHWYPGGHLAQFRRGAALREVRRLLRDTKLLVGRG
jgi:pimeloyl-ACP methyl ester carboxylesterase